MIGGQINRGNHEDAGGCRRKKGGPKRKGHTRDEQEATHNVTDLKDAKTAPRRQAKTKRDNLQGAMNGYRADRGN